MGEVLTGTEKNSRIEHMFTIFSMVMAVVTAVIGFLVLLGWIFNDPFLKTMNALYVTMKANTAVAFILAGVSLMLVLDGKRDSIKYRIGIFFICAVAAISLLNVAEDVFGLRLGFDQLLFRDINNTAGTVNPGRMAPNTAVTFILLAVSILLMDMRDNKIFIFGRVLAFTAGLISSMALIGYCYGVSVFLGIQLFTKMSLYAALALLSLFLAVIFARPGRGIMAGISADNPGGMMLRYSIPTIIFIMFMLGWINVAGARRGFYDSYFATSFFTVIRIIILLVMVFIISKYLNRLYGQRLEKEKALREIETSYNDIKEVNRLKSQFISVVSHELRTPLTVIKGYSTFLFKETAGTLNEQQKDFVGIIERNSSRLEHIIGEMTDISRIESGILSIEKQPQNIKEMMDSCVKDIGRIASKQVISLTSDIEPENLVMNIDRARMEQAIINLLNNSIKFTPCGGKVKIIVKFPYKGILPDNDIIKHGGEKDYALITVSDTGSGIEKKNIEKVFEKFFQAEEHTVRRFQGMGLGLNIAKNIINGHGGIIWVESEGRDKGATFYILLPNNTDAVVPDSGIRNLN